MYGWPTSTCLLFKRGWGLAQPQNQCSMLSSSLFLPVPLIYNSHPVLCTVFPRFWKSVPFDFTDKRNNRQLRNWDGSGIVASHPDRNVVKRNITGLFRFLEIAGDFITMKLQCGLTSFQKQHCLGRMTVIRKSSGKHDTVSSLLRRFSLLDSLAVNYFWEQCYKIVLESADGLDSHKNTWTHGYTHTHNTLGAGAICQVY